MIETLEFDVPQKILFRMMFWRLIRYFTWSILYGGIVLLAIGLGHDDSWLQSIGATIFLLVPLAVFFGVLAYFHARKYAYSKKPPFIWQKRTMKFGEGSYFLDCEDGTKGQGPLANIIRVDIADGFYRLHLGSGGHFLVQQSTFQSEEDRKRFETEIIGAKMRVRQWPWKHIAFFIVFSVLVIGLALCM